MADGPVLIELSNIWNPRPPSQCPPQLLHNVKPKMPIFLPFGQAGYEFQYHPSTKKSKKLLPVTVYRIFVVMDSEHSSYRIYLPSVGKLWHCRKNESTVLQEENYKIALVQQLNRKIISISTIRGITGKQRRNGTGYTIKMLLYKMQWCSYRIKVENERHPSLIIIQWAWKIPKWANEIHM